MLLKVFGVEATTITVEVNIDKGIGYHLVGWGDLECCCNRHGLQIRTIGLLWSRC